MENLLSIETIAQLHEAASAASTPTKKDQYIIEMSVITSWIHYVKLIFVLGKVVLINYMMIQAILARLRKHG